jgi:hypothetical protein
MVSTTYGESFNHGQPNRLDNSLFSNKPSDTCYTSKANFSNMMLFQQPNEKEFEIRKMKSTCEKSQSKMSQDDAASSQQNKKRSRKAYTKRTKKR